MASPLLQAALSHYIAKRDKALAELDIYLNKPVGVGEHATVVDEVIKLFAELESADSIIDTIRVIIQGNDNQLQEEMQALSNSLKKKESESEN